MRFIGVLDSVKRGKKTKFIAGFITVLIIAMIIFSGPASAITVSLTLQGGNESTGIYDYKAVVDIHTNDVVPLDLVYIKLTNDNTSAVSNCYFNLVTKEYNSTYSTESTSGICSKISIANITNNAAYTTSYGYNYGYGYGDGLSPYDTEGLNNVSWNYGYGYGYANGYGYNSFTENLSTTGEVIVLFRVDSANSKFTAGNTYSIKAGIAGVKTGAIEYTYYNKDSVIFIGKGGDSVNPSMNSASTTNIDNFYSVYDKYVNISVNVTDASSLTVTANFTNISATLDCGNGANAILNLTLAPSGLYEGSCNIASGIGSITTPTPQLILVRAVDSASNVNATNLNIISQNMDVPRMPGTPGPCNLTRFGTETTNFTRELNFSDIDFIIDTEANFTCISNGDVNLPDFIDVNLINISSVDISTQAKAAKVLQLPANLQVNITAPNQFGNSRVYINSTFFAELNTAATIKFYHMPFSVQPNISADVGAAGVSGTSVWVSNGFSSTFHATTGNLTFTVFGFSGYDIGDDVDPTITYVTPINSEVVSSNIANVSVIINGTGTGLSTLWVGIENSTGANQTIMDNSSVSCTKDSTKTVYTCTGNGTYGPGLNTILVSVKDYGGASGNSVESPITVSYILGGDHTPPTVTLVAPTTGTTTSTASMLVNYTAKDDSGLNMSCHLYVDGVNRENATLVNGTYHSYTVTSLVNEQSYAWYVNCSDSSNNSMISETRYFNRFSPTAVEEVMNATANNTELTLAPGNTTAVIPAGSLITELTINSNTTTNDSQEIKIDLILLSENSSTQRNATLPNEFTLTRDTNSSIDYTVVFSANTTISGNASWDGTIILPTVQNVSDYNVTDSTALSIDAVIKLGASGELNFSLPVKLVLSGMAGKTAAWARSGNSTLTEITTTCNSVTAPTNIDSITTRECFVDSGSDLVIWTYHFTVFAAYTPATASTTDSTTTGGSGGDLITLTTSELAAGYTKSLYVGEVLRFELAGSTHNFFLTAIRENSVSIRILSNPITATLLVGEEKKFDINTDGYYDLVVKLNSIDNKKASITIKSINESISTSTETTIPSEGEPTPTETTPGIGETITKVAKSPWTMIIVAIIIILAIILYVVYKRNHRYPTYKHHHKHN